MYTGGDGSRSLKRRRSSGRGGYDFNGEEGQTVGLGLGLQRRRSTRSAPFSVAKLGLGVKSQTTPIERTGRLGLQGRRSSRSAGELLRQIAREERRKCVGGELHQACICFYSKVGKVTVGVLMSYCGTPFQTKWATVPIHSKRNGLICPNNNSFLVKPF